jgi:antitoxin ParD1/3/4
LKADELKLEVLRNQIKAGVDALDRGTYVELDDAGLDAALDALASSSAR